MNETLRRILWDYIELLNSLPPQTDTAMKVAEACACYERLSDNS